MVAFSLEEERNPYDANSCKGRSTLQTQREIKKSQGQMLENSECTTGVKPVNLLFLVDGSGSVTKQGFRQTREFVKNVTGDMSFKGAQYVAVSQFSASYTSHIGFKKGYSKEKVMEAVDNMKYHSRKVSLRTCTIVGMSGALAEFVDARSDFVKMMVVIVDGDPSLGCELQTQADDAHSQGIAMVAIGVGANVTKDELGKIAGPEGIVLQVSDYGQLDTVVRNTKKIICEEISTPEPTPAPTPRPTQVTPKCTAALNTVPVDIVFLVDSSGSVGESGHDESKKFVLNVAKGINLGTGSADARMAVVQFSYSQWVEIALPSGTSYGAVEKPVNNMSWKTGGTQTPWAINFTTQTIFPEARSNATKMLIVMTDGYSFYPSWTKAAADFARSQGVQCTAVGIGPNTHDSELEGIAGDDGTILKVENYDKLIDIVENTTKLICEEVSPPMSVKPSS